MKRKVYTKIADMNDSVMNINRGCKNFNVCYNCRMEVSDNPVNTVYEKPFFQETLEEKNKSNYFYINLIS